MQPVLHLTALNPHVASTIPRPGAFFMPRQPAPSSGAAAEAAAAATGATAWGVSAFAFQGTNAHALLALGSGSDSSPVLALGSPQVVTWALQRFWVAAQPHPLVGCVARSVSGAAGTAALFETDLLQPKHAYLWDHAVAGRPLLPGAAFLEAAAGSLQAAAAAAGSAEALLLTAVAIPAPLELPALATEQQRHLLLQCQVDAASGRVRLASLGSDSRSREHLYGAAAAAAAAVQQPQQALQISRPAAAALLLLSAAMSAQHRRASIGTVDGTRQDGRARSTAVDPACVDAAFHLGALPAGASAALPQLRVPAGIAAYQSGGRGCSAMPMLGACQPVTEQASGSAVNDYWLAPDNGGASICCVAGLEARPLGRMPPAPAPAPAATASAASSTAAGASSDSSMLYVSAWLATQTASPEAAAPASRSTPAALFSARLSAQRAAAAGVMCLQQSGTTAAGLASTGAQLAAAAVPAPGPAAAAAITAGLLQGLLKAAAQENASGVYAAADTDSFSAESRSARQAATMMLSKQATAAPDLHGSAVRSNTSFRPLLLPASALGQGTLAAEKPASRGATVITGGTGTLGQLVAAYLASGDSHQHLHLLGRSGRLGVGTGGAALLDSPAELMVSSCDAAAALDASAAVAAATSQRQLAALMHAGGVLADALLANLTATKIRQALAPKVDALANLQPALQLHPAATQLLFSSVAALLGSPGQANYSAANAALDAMAQRVQLSGQPAVSVQWGAWAGAGMASQDRSIALRVQRMGMAMIAPADGLAALRSLVGTPAPAVVAGVPFLLDRLAAQQRQAGVSGEPAFFSALVGGNGGSPAPPTQASAVAVDRAAVLADVQDVLHSILGPNVSADEPLMAAGLDSLGAVELRNSLEGRLGLRLPGTLVFDYPTASAIADLVIAQLGAASAGAAASHTGGVAAAAVVQSERVAAEVAAAVADILGAASLDPNQPLMAAGLDSLGAVELKNSLEARLGLQLPFTLVFDYPSVAALSGYIASRVQPATTALDLLQQPAGMLMAGTAFTGPQPLALAALATRSPKARRTSLPGHVL